MIRAFRSLPLALASMALLAGCAQIGMQPRRVSIHHGKTSMPSGLEYEELFVGQGPAAKPGDHVTFEYTVWLEDGTRVDSTYDRGVAVTVRLGSAPLKAWDEGLIGIRPQGRRRLVVPPNLAYGSKGVEGMIPPNATLIMEILALEVGRAGSAARG